MRCKKIKIIKNENFLITNVCQICKTDSASSSRSTVEPNQISKFKTLHFYQKVFYIIIYSTQTEQGQIHGSYFYHSPFQF